MGDESYIREQIWGNNLDWVGKSELGNVACSSCETPDLPAAADGVCLSVISKRKNFSHQAHLLQVPSVTHSKSENHIPYQFDRHAPGRISTSPTLRRLRNNILSQLVPHQENSKSIRLDSPVLQTDKEEGTSQSPSPGSEGFSFPHPDPHMNALVLREKTASVGPISITPHQKDDSSSDQILPNSRRIGSCFLSEGEQNSQEGVQKLDLPNTSPFNSAERRHSSVVVSLPGLEVFPGDLLISDGAAEFLYDSASLQSSESKKPWWPFAKKGSNKDKHKQTSDLEACLSTLTIKISECAGGYELHSVKDKTWHEIMTIHQVDPQTTDNQLDTRTKEAVWELFTTECTYFLDHLLVLKMVFMNTLKYLQNKEFLLDVGSGLLFANLEELSQVSMKFVTNLFTAIKDHLLKSTSSIDFFSKLAESFQGNMCQSHQIYCLNYTSAIFYLEKLKKREDFGIYLKWCEQNEHCKRLHLSELLVAPLHRLTRYPLLLKNIWKNTAATEKAVICSIKEKVEKCIRDLEGKVKWLDNFQKFKQLQEIIIWPPLWDQDKRFFVPECLKHLLRDHLNENIISPTKRYLLHEGRLNLAEHMRLTDVYLFLFDDLLLITKPNRHKKKSGSSEMTLTRACPSFTPELKSLLEEGGSCIVFNQPIPLDRLIIKSIDCFYGSVSGLQNAFLVQHENRYQQCIAAFLLQAQAESIKKTWITQMETAVTNYAERHKVTKNSFFSLPAESSEI